MLIGNVGRDPEVRYLEGSAAGGGRKVATFTLATSERYKDRNGESRENTEWHNIVAWGNSAEIAEKYIRKGSQLYIEGRLRTRSWTDQSGVKKFTTEINVDNLQLLGRRESSGTEGGYAAPVPAATPYSAPTAPASQPHESRPAATTPHIQENLNTEDTQVDDLPF